ncbi:MAG TPA: tRNA pseudouridine(38-40) synthase TruA, partial [Lacibacter sp.]|nr:tRNA pseudouridine(38-40) synthase TruA [Lacibacter sp.]
MRYAIELSYRGTNYNGWQIQPNAPSVQQEIEKRLTQLSGNISVSVVGCGRTDTGVHASYYVLHFDSDREHDCGELKYKLNKMLPDDIAVFSVQPVSDEFHARFSATSRTYRYFLHKQKDAFSEQSLLLNREIDVERMNEAAKFVLGKQDFTSLSKLHTDVKTNICTVTEAQWVETRTGWYFQITADRFLRNMVRATVGTLLEVGYGAIQPEEIKNILAAKDRGEAKLSVPAHALFLSDVKYP